MLNPDVKKRWVEALRSGKYKQAHGQLTHGIGYCCLGVLCEVEKFPEWDGKYIFAEVPDNAGRSICDENELPEHILARVGLSQNDQVTLIRLNDGHIREGKIVEAVDFPEIADYIEKNL